MKTMMNVLLGVIDMWRNIVELIFKAMAVVLFLALCGVTMIGLVIGGHYEAISYVVNTVKETFAGFCE